MAGRLRLSPCLLSLAGPIASLSASGLHGSCLCRPCASASALHTRRTSQAHRILVVCVALAKCANGGRRIFRRWLINVRSGDPPVASRGFLLLERAGSNHLKCSCRWPLCTVTWYAEFTASRSTPESSKSSQGYSCTGLWTMHRTGVAMCRQRRIACTEGDAPGLGSTSSESPSPSRLRS